MEKKGIYGEHPIDALCHGEGFYGAKRASMTSSTDATGIRAGRVARKGHLTPR